MDSPRDSVMDGLNSVRNALESSSDSWSTFLVVTTIAVAVGVIIEIASTSLEILEAQREGHPLKLPHILTLIGGALVALAVGAEGWAEVKISWIEGDLRRNNSEAQAELTSRENIANAKVIEVTKKFGNLDDFVKTKTSEVEASISSLNASADKLAALNQKLGGAVREQKKELGSTSVVAKDALDRAAAAETKAANLLAENIELERAIGPRTIDQGALAEAVKSLPRVPIFISWAEYEEAKDTAGFISFALTGISLGGQPVWSVARLPPPSFPHEGIDIQYVGWPSASDKTPENVAQALCKSLEAQEIDVRTEAIRGPSLVQDWPQNIPNGAIIIRVGTKPNHFWINKLLRSKGMEEMPRSHFCSSGENLEWWRQHTKPPPNRPPPK